MDVRCSQQYTDGTQIDAVDDQIGQIDVMLADFLHGCVFSSKIVLSFNCALTAITANGESLTGVAYMKCGEQIQGRF